MSGSQQPRIAIVVLTIAFTANAMENLSRTYPVPPGSPSPVRTEGVAIDRHGLIWIAAASGVFRFDGVHYHKIPDFPFASANSIAIDPQQTVWAAGKEGLARYAHDQWQVVFKQAATGMVLAPSGLWVTADGLHWIAPAGEDRRFPDIRPTGALTVDRSGALWFPCSPNICTLRPPDMRVESHPNPAPGDWKKVVPGQGSKIWLGSLSELASIENGRETWRQKVFARDDGAYVPPEGLDPFLTPGGSVEAIRFQAKPQPGLTLRPGGLLQFTYFASEDSLWGGWGDGLARLTREPTWQTWSGGMFNVVSAQGFLFQKSSTPLLLSDHGIYRLKPDGSQWTRAVESAVDVDRMIEDGHGGYWATSREEGLKRLGPDLREQQRFPHLCVSNNALRGLLRDRQGRTWIAGKDPACFFEVTGEPNHWTFHPQAIPGEYNNTVSIQQDSAGRIWVGYQDGLDYRDNSGHWTALKTSEPVTHVREFSFDGEDAIWVSRRRNGHFLKLERNGEIWNVRKFDSAAYPPDDTYDLHRDSRGWIWRGTGSSLLVARSGHTGPNDWLKIMRSNGLGSKNVSLGGWAEDSSGNIWIAGTDGVTTFKPSLDWFDAPKNTKPFVTRVTVNGRTWLDPDRMPAELPHGAALIEVDLGSIDAAPFRQTRLRWRLRSNAPWAESADGSLKLTGLSDGDYTLEAVYTGDGQPQVFQWSFRVGNAVAYLLLRGVAFVLAGLIALGAWTRREWLHYWIAKPLFLAKTLLGDKESEVVWSSHVGHTLAKRFEIIQPISRGGFSVTYRARDLVNGGEAAVKVLHRSPGQESFVRHRFAHEVAALHTLNHPGVVRLVDSWISPGGEPCLAMEFLDGPTLREIESQGPMTKTRAAKIIEQLGSALSAVHERGIVHRDLKPENTILLDAGSANERIVIIDFGTSAARGPDQDLESTTTLTGSLHYLAPERLTRRYSTASDVYSLGVMILEMLTGKRPAEFEVAPLDPAFIRVAGESMGEPAATLLVEALEHQPAKRPTDIVAWTHRLAELLRNPA